MITFVRALLMSLLLVTWTALCGAADYHKTKVAVLDFQQQGTFSNQDVGKIVAEWFTTSLVEAGRFEVIERRLMQQILQEQKMGSSGLLDPASASRLGKLLGVKTVVTGTVQSYERTYELNVRLINVETGAIITADRVRAGSTTSLNDLVAKMSARIIRHFPLDGYVVKREADRVMIDLGRQAGVRPGMQFSVYVEGEPVRHPKTGEVLSIERVPKGLLKIESVWEKTALASVLQENPADLILAGYQVRSSQSDEVLNPVEAAKLREEERKREEAERKAQEKRDKEARKYQEKLEKEAREREEERLEALEKERKQEAERLAQAAISGLTPLTVFPAQRENLRSLAVSPDNSQLATGDDDGQIVIWDLAKGLQTETLPGHLKGAVVALEFSGDGRQLVSAGKDKRVVLWDLGRRQQLAAIELKDVPSDLHMARSGRLVAIGSKGSESWLWEVKTNRLRAIKNTDDVLAVAISPDGRLLATAGQGRQIVVWDAVNGRQLKSLSGHSGDVRSLAFVGDSRYLASASEDKLVLIWDLQRATQHQILRGHADEVIHLAVSANGQRIVSGAAKMLIAWDGMQGRELRRYRLEKGGDLVAMTPDGQTLVVARGKQLHAYRLE